MAEHRGCEHPLCMVPGCMSDVPKEPPYLRKRGVCLAHLRAHSVYIDGIWHRFCQQCGRFQPLSEFQDDRRSCEVALRAHNARRRVKCRGRYTQLPSTDTRVEKKSGAKKGAAALKAAAAEHYPSADPRWAAAAAAAAAGAYAASAPLAHSHSMPAGALKSSSMAGWAAGYSGGLEGSPAYAGKDPAGSALHCAPYAHMPGMEQYWLWQQQQGLWYPQQLQQSCAHLQHMPLLLQQQQRQQLQPEAAMSAACMYPGSVFMSGAAMVNPHFGADAALARVYSAPASYLEAQCRRPALMPANAPVAPPQHSTMQQQHASPDAGSKWNDDGPWAGHSEDVRTPLTPQHSDIDSDDTLTTQGDAPEPAQHDDQEQKPAAQGRTEGTAAGTRAACAQQVQASAGAAAEMGASCRQAGSGAHVAYARIAWPAPQRIDRAALLNMANRHATGLTAGRAPAQLLQALQQQQRGQAGHQGAVDNAAGLQTPGGEAQCLPGTMWPGAEMQASADLSGSPALQSASPSAVLGCSQQLEAESAAGSAAGEMQGGKGGPADAAAVHPGPVGDECAPPPAAFGGTAAPQQSSTQHSGVRYAKALDSSYADPAAVAFLESIGAIPAMLQASGQSVAQLAAAGSALDQDLEVLLDDALDALLFDTTGSDQGGGSGCESGDWESQAGGHGCDDVSELVDV